jgi:hypothetical protein
LKDTVLEIVQGRNPKLEASLLETGKSVAAATAFIATSVAADLAGLDVIAHRFRGGLVGQGDVGVFQDAQEVFARVMEATPGSTKARKPVLAWKIASNRSRRTAACAGSGAVR